MDLRDARRLASTCLLLTGALLLWIILLALDEANLFNWGWPTNALNTIGLNVWMWIGIGTLVVVAAGLVGIVYAMGLGASAPTRQVQCGECQAVFFIPDNGRRPLTHTCPNCKAFGIYEGEKRAAAPASSKPRAVGSPSVAKTTQAGSTARQLDLDCPSCKNRFTVVDSGPRPLRVTCPRCSTSGMLN